MRGKRSVSGAPHSCYIAFVSLVLRDSSVCPDTYNLDVFSAAGLEQDEPHVWVFDQRCCYDKIAALVFGIAVACTTAVGATKEPEACQDEVRETHCSVIVGRLDVPPCVDPHRSQVENVHLRSRGTKESWHTRPREDARPVGHIANEVSRSAFTRIEMPHFK